ncbi:MAG: hypothetical protein FWC48_02380, partial [Actinomycetia bacterium]|nr:hypothetical protein [Actinomycetes bacterium]
MHKRILAVVMSCALAISLMATPQLAAAVTTTVSVGTEAALDTAIANASTTAGDSTIIQLTASFNLTTNKTIAANKNITIESASGGPYALTRTTTAGNQFIVNAGATLTLTNVTVNGTTSTGALINITGNGILNIDNGAIIQGQNSTAGNNATISIVSTGGTINILPGSIIRNNTAVDGAVIFAQNTIAGAININISGGEIYGNKATGGQGGVIRANVNVNINISGGTIRDNIANSVGGGMYISGNATYPSSLTMTGGTISGNTVSNG